MQMDTAAELLAAGREATVEAAFRTGAYDEAEALLESALERAQREGDRASEAGALSQLGWLMHSRTLDRDREGADPDAEEALFRRALAIWRELGDLAGTAESLFYLGMVQHVLRDDWTGAIPHLREALALADVHADALVRSEAHRHLGFYHMAADVQHDLALDHLRTSLALREQWGDPRWIPSGTLVLGIAELFAGRRGEAIEHLRLAVRQARDAGLSARRIATAEEWLGRAESGAEPTLR
jgi:tetratricopeptide (TPR) repeat protein